jgi:pimeloyl-ACP methyl ester carboxylesterase
MFCKFQSLWILIGSFILASLFPAITQAEPAVPAFYQAVIQMKADGRLGQVIKKVPVKTQVPGAQAWRIAYISSDVQGRKTISTGLVMAPIGKAPVGGRPLLVWAHGTTGTAQNCGPSQIDNPAQSLNQYFLINGNSWTDYGLPSIEHFIKQGYVVVATDYQGLGGGGKHQYAVSATNARDAINSARAAATISELGAGSKAVMYGWSQGGGSTLAAAGLNKYITQAGTAKDGIEFLGFVALAPLDLVAAIPPGKLNDESAQKLLMGLEESFGGNVFNFAHFAMAMWGSTNAFSNIQLSNIFTDEGAKVVDEIMSNKCMHTLADTLNYNFGASFKSLLKPQAENAQAWAEAFKAGGVSSEKPIAPVIIYWGAADTVLPPSMGQAYRQKMCQQGGNVARVQLPGKQTHFSTPAASATSYIAWIADRFAGKEMVSGCISEVVME